MVNTVRNDSLWMPHTKNLVCRQCRCCHERELFSSDTFPGVSNISE